MHILKYLLTPVLLLSSFAEANSSMQLSDERAGDLIVNNRILAKVMDKTISVIDVMKKMDIYLDRNYPQYTSSKTAKFQFYNNNWKASLEQIIKNELILTDAEEKKITITDGDVREEIQNRFGPNVMGTLDKIGITYEEARKAIHDELIVQKMSWFKIHSKALNNVTSLDIKKAYGKFCAENAPKENWKYQVLTVKAPKHLDAEEIAKTIYSSLLKDKKDLTELVSSFKERGEIDPSVSVTVSQDYVMEDQDLSKANKSILASLADGSFSLPILQQSRVDNAEVFRIFHLKEHTKSMLPLFQKIANDIKGDLIQEEVERESSRYMAKLMQRYGYDQTYWQELIPPNFQPFSLN